MGGKVELRRKRLLLFGYKFAFSLSHYGENDGIVGHGSFFRSIGIGLSHGAWLNYDPCSKPMARHYRD